MIEKKLEMKNKLGLHARPAALFVQLTNQYKQVKIKVKVLRDNEESEEVDGKSIMGLMMLAAEAGSILLIKISGEKDKEEELMAKIETLIENKFGEN
ncbi:MAG: HPr family phosphocarrier protein [bacterium]|nr:HPr family phosphocarrier protein [bacterium]MDD5755746.1 HPr family phosphocarrier protein [bacterium]